MVSCIEVHSPVYPLGDAILQDYHGNIACTGLGLKKNLLIYLSELENQKIAYLNQWLMEERFISGSYSGLNSFMDMDVTRLNSLMVCKSIVAMHC